MSLIEESPKVNAEGRSQGGNRDKLADCRPAASDMKGAQITKVSLSTNQHDQSCVLGSYFREVQTEKTNEWDYESFRGQAKKSTNVRPKEGRSGSRGEEW